MIKNLEVVDKRIIIRTDEGQYQKEFDYKIKKTIEVENKIFVLIESYKNPYKNRNVFCLNAKAEVMWQIQDPDNLSTNQKSSSAAFTDLKKVDEKVIAWTWDGYRFDIDMQNGQLLNASFTK